MSHSHTIENRFGEITLSVIRLQAFVDLAVRVADPALDLQDADAGEATDVKDKVNALLHAMANELQYTFLQASGEEEAEEAMAAVGQSRATADS